MPVLDNLEQAQSHLNDEGLAIVIKQFRDILTAEGVEEIPAQGSQFDRSGFGIQDDWHEKGGRARDWCHVSAGLREQGACGE